MTGDMLDATVEAVRVALGQARPEALAMLLKLLERSREMADDRARAVELLGKLVRFAGHALSPYRVITVHWDGMIELEGWSGQFAADLFELAYPAPAPGAPSAPGVTRGRAGMRNARLSRKRG